WRAAAFLWIRPLRDARSRSLTAANLSSALPLEARLSAVRSADFWARLRMAAARDFRMFFLAEARFGTNSFSKYFCWRVAVKFAAQDPSGQAADLTAVC